LSEPFIIKMKEYINFDNIDKRKLTFNIINNCYEYIDKELIQKKLDNKNILPEVRLYYEVN